MWNNKYLQYIKKWTLINYLNFLIKIVKKIINIFFFKMFKK